MVIQQRAAGVIVFKIGSKGERSWLLIRHAAGHWELPKGHVEAGEAWRTTAVRELAEETGLNDVELIPGFGRTISYMFRDRKKGLIQKEVFFVMGRCDMEQGDIERGKNAPISLSDEHTDFIFLNFDKALRKLTHAGTRAILRDAETFLTLPELA